MKNIFRLVTLPIILTSLLHSIFFFIKVICYKMLYKLATEIKDDFYYETLKCMFLIICFELLHSYIYIKAKHSINNSLTDLYNGIMDKIILLKYSEILKYNKNQLVQIHDMFNVLESVCEKIYINLPRNIVYVIYYINIIKRFSLTMVMMMIGSSILTTFIINHYSKLRENEYIKHYNKENEIKKNILEVINNLKLLKMHYNVNPNNIEATIIKNNYNTKLVLKNNDIKYSNIIATIPDITGTLMTCMIYLIGGIAVRSNLLKPIDLIFLGSNSNFFIYYIINIKYTYDDYIKHLKQMSFIFDLYENNMIDGNINDGNINDGNINDGNINYANINDSRSYETQNDKYNDKYKIIYNNTKNFVLDHSERKLISITGKNGCGKTSMMYSILGLNDLTMWSLKGYNKQLDEWKLINYLEARELICMVFQEPLLFDSTVMYNIKHGNNADDRKVFNLSKQIGIDKWLELSKNRNIGYNGEFISGGEKKKIQLMNAFLSNKTIYVFDEPTNNLDKETRDWYINQINNFKNEKLILIITHDNELIRISDMVVEINKFN